jgi:hypothetical protein
MMLARQRVEAALERVQSHLELPLETEDLEIVRHVSTNQERAARARSRFLRFAMRGAPDLIRLSP